MSDEEQIEAMKKQLSEALEIMNEVKPYRSIFYKQRVAHWQQQTQIILNAGKNPNRRTRP